MSKQNLKAVGGYIFAGGFTIGMQRAGFDVLAHLEDGGYGVDTARRNFPELPIFVGEQEWPLESLSEEGVDVVYGNPPCAAWSGLNGQKTSTGTWKNDDRIHCTLKHFTLLESLRPDVWVWESVERAWSTGREFVEDLVDRAVELGYSVDLVLFDLQYVGGRHRRRRFFFVATKIDVDWLAEPFQDPPTAGEVLEKVRELGVGRETVSSYAEAWHHTYGNEALVQGWERANPESEREYKTFKTGKTVAVGRPAFKIYKLDSERVCPTVVGPSLFHPHEPRFLTLNETKALCGYPEDFELVGGTNAVYDQLTRAVMPDAGEWLGERLAAGLEKRLSAGHVREDGSIRPRVRLVDLRKPEQSRVVELERQEDWVGDGAPRWQEPSTGLGKEIRRTAAKKSEDRTPREPKRRTVPLDEVVLPHDVPRPEQLGCEKSGEYIQALLRFNHEGRRRLSDEHVAVAVLRYFENRKTTTSDVAYQRAQLRKTEGIEVARIWYDDAELTERKEVANG